MSGIGLPEIQIGLVFLLIYVFPYVLMILTLAWVCKINKKLDIVISKLNHASATCEKPSSAKRDQE